MSLPIVFIQAGRMWYVPYALHQAKTFNPHSPIYLISDVAVKQKGIANIPTQYDARTQELATSYQHFCTNPPSYELFCIQRWFLLHDFMVAQNFEKCYSIDSDILIYCDVTKDAQNYPVELTYIGSDDTIEGYSGKLSGPLNGFIERAALKRFCDYMLWFYTDETSLERARWYFKIFEENGVAGGISDMTLFQWFREQDGGQFSDYSVPCADGSVHDHNIRVSDGFEMDGIHKKFEWQAGIPYGTHLGSGQKARFKSIHFQGSEKPLIPSYLSVKDREVWVMRLQQRSRGLVRRVLEASQKLKRT